ncbi:MAG: cyclodeaminase/cyclohydrolase family protein [Candidatus Omnitrophica bacterium]|nr:cyclodeaminase/cyclohydrolase family protein [Candidatus Omnitrophota bacterium]MDE2231307.1 cyclodeaminase/cyclohydrolase family protein [Candidatus Omnitrophota bacterium]
MVTIDFKNKSLHEYLDQLSRREPVPGGGSAAALTAALGAGLISMVTNYSMGRKANTKAVEQRLGTILAQSEPIRLRLLQLVSLDSEAYLKISAARSLDKRAQRLAAREGKAVPLEVCKLCYKAIRLTPYLVERGNPYLLSDVEVALELLLSAFNAARVMVRVNS